MKRYEPTDMKTATTKKTKWNALRVKWHFSTCSDINLASFLLRNINYIRIGTRHSPVGAHYEGSIFWVAAQKMVININSETNVFAWVCLRVWQNMLHFRSRFSSVWTQIHIHSKAPNDDFSNVFDSKKKTVELFTKNTHHFNSTQNILGIYQEIVRPNDRHRILSYANVNLIYLHGTNHILFRAFLSASVQIGYISDRIPPISSDTRNKSVQLPHISWDIFHMTQLLLCSPSNIIFTIHSASLNPNQIWC